MLRLIGLEGYEDKNTTLLSGGQQQRVAIARALVNEPKVLLLDEPVAALDLKLRKEMQYELKRIQQEVGITFIFVTHDQEEALTMSDKIVVMKNGEIQQVGTCLLYTSIMKAAVYCGKEDLRVKEVPIREPEDNEVVIRVKYCGVCGTDIHIFHGDGGACDVTPPLIPGHEFSGVVEKVGAAVKTVKPGDRVAGNPNDMCGECYFCKNGKEHFCENNIGVGTTVDGGFAEYVVMHEKQVYKFSENLNFIEAAMAEPCLLYTSHDETIAQMADRVIVIADGKVVS